MGQIQVTRSRLSDWPLWSVAVAIAIWTLAVYTAFEAIQFLSGEKIPFTSPGVTLAGMLALDASLVIAVMLSARLLEGRVRLAGFGFIRSATGRRRTVALSVATWFAFLAFTVAWKQLIPPTEKQNIVEHLGAHESRALWTATFLMLGIVAPICEEVFFRGFIFAALWKRLSIVPSAAITGVLFALVHLSASAKLLVVALGVFGALLCVLRAMTGSLIPCIAVHSLNNSVSYGVSEHMNAAVVLAMALVAVATTVAIGRFLAARAYTQDDGSAPADDGSDGQGLPAGSGTEGTGPGPAAGDFGSGGS